MFYFFPTFLIKKMFCTLGLNEITLGQNNSSDYYIKDCLTNKSYKIVMVTNNLDKVKNQRKWWHGYFYLRTKTNKLNNVKIKFKGKNSTLKLIPSKFPNTCYTIESISLLNYYYDYDDIKNIKDCTLYDNDIEQLYLVANHFDLTYLVLYKSKNLAFFFPNKLMFKDCKRITYEKVSNKYKLSFHLGSNQIDLLIEDGLIGKGSKYFNGCIIMFEFRNIWYNALSSSSCRKSFIAAISNFC